MSRWIRIRMWATTLVALTALMASGQDDELIEDLLVDLTAREAHVRELASRDLIKLGPAVVPHLAQAIEGNDAELRMAAIELLGAIGPAASGARDALQAVATHPEAAVRKAAKAALAKIVVKEAPKPVANVGLPQLLNGLSSPASSERTAALVALAGMGHAAAPAVPRLIEMLNTAADEARVLETLRDLGAVATTAGPTLLERFPRARPNLRWRYYDALCAVRPGAADLVRATAAATEFRPWFLGVVSEVGEELIPDLIAVMQGDGDRDQRATAAEALGALGSRARPAVGPLTLALEDSTGAVRRQAAKALGRIGKNAESALPGLIALLDDPSRRARIEATQGITGILLEARRGNSHPANRSGAVERAINDGLDWLADHQEPEGHWDCVAHTVKEGPLASRAASDPEPLDAGVTGLAALAFVQAGVAGRVDGDARDQVLRRALQNLLTRQGADGFVGLRSSKHGIYSHGTATRALLKAATRDRHPLLGHAAERAVQQIIERRNPEGAWRYVARDGDNDTSVTCWMLLNLKIAATHGLTFQPDAIDGGLEYLDSMVDPATGRFGYHEPGSPVARTPASMDLFPPKHSEANTAAAVLTNLALRDREGLTLDRSIGLIRERLPHWSPATIDQYYWFYGTKALYQAGGAPWTSWKSAVQEALQKGQARDGSFEPAGPWGTHGGRVYSTAMGVLTLQVLQGSDRRYQHDYRPSGRQRAGWRALEKAASDTDSMLAEIARTALRRLSFAYCPESGHPLE